jgi:hypothetical protein
MILISKLTKLIVKSFVSPFLTAFFITLFILVMQFVWRYIDDFMGKGLEFLVILELINLKHRRIFLISITSISLGNVLK